QLAAVGFGLLDRDPGHPLGLPDDLRPLDHALGLHPGGGDDLVGLPAGPLQELLPLLQQPAGLAQLLGKSLEHLVEQLQHLVAVHDGRVRQRHRPRRLDQLPQVLEQVAEVAAEGRWGRQLLVDRRGAHAGGPSLKRWSSRAATTGGTRLETSPPKRATSRTRLEDRNEYWGLVARKNVSMVSAPWMRAKSTRRPAKNSIWTLPRWPVTSTSIDSRSARLNRDAAFCG